MFGTSGSSASSSWSLPRRSSRTCRWTDEREDAVLAHRAEVKAVLDRDDDRLLVVVGPCSVHDPEAAIDYAAAAAARAGTSSDDLCIAMRVYFEKPRTTTGWKGLINDPHLDGSRDVNFGLHTARRCCSR